MSLLNTLYLFLSIDSFRFCLVVALCYLLFHSLYIYLLCAFLIFQETKFTSSKLDLAISSFSFHIVVVENFSRFVLFGS